MFTTTFPFYGGADVVAALPGLTVQLHLAERASVCAMLSGWRFTTPTAASDVALSALVQGF